jgi:hypothetical protein
MVRLGHGDVSHILQHRSIQIYCHQYIQHIENIKMCFWVYIVKLTPSLTPHNENNTYVRLEIYHNSRMLIGSVYNGKSGCNWPTQSVENVALFVEHNSLKRKKNWDKYKTVLFPVEAIHQSSTRIFSAGVAENYEYMFKPLYWFSQSCGSISSRHI